nr:hypothetical protein HUO10_005320 [Paraburkholderia busanensis]
MVKMKLVGCPMLMLGLSSPTFATDVYREWWNPPEARGRLFTSQNCT